MNVLARLRLLLLVGSGALGSTAWAVPAESLQDIHHRVRLEGHGPLTVIFEAGLGDTMEVWSHVQPRIADCTLTVAYNRAGYAGSDPANGPRDSATIVAELRAELSRRNIKPPYILVGHSLGGLYMQYFARNYPHEVAGLLLLDSTHWNQGLSLEPSANTPYAGRTAVTLFMPWIMRRELGDSATAGEEVHTSPQAVNLPTIVLSSTRGSGREPLDALMRAERLQDEIAADFPGSSHERVDASGHYIQRDRPDVVVGALRKLAGCSSSTSDDARHDTILLN
jgi:pimeloyl-ACP methyl ester carboxylesterase